MAPSLTQPYGYLAPADAMQVAQQAPTILKSNPRTVSSVPLISLFTAPETADLWVTYENLLLSCLRAGDDQAAHDCLERMILRFSGENERIMALKGLVKEAEADGPEQLGEVLKEYDAILQDDVANIPIAKRKVALLKSIDKIPDAITALTNILEITPTDSEGWAELSDLYLRQGLYSQAIYALEEVLVLAPNAWNIQARLGEVLLMAANAGDGSQKYLAESLKRFCRSIELCEDYLRGYYGLKKVTDRLLGDTGTGTVKSKRSDLEDFTIPEQKVLEKLNEAATTKLAEIVRKYGAKDKSWQGYDADEVAAARDLLEKTRPELVR